MKEEEGVAVGLYVAVEPFVIRLYPSSVECRADHRPVLHPEIVFELDDIDIWADGCGKAVEPSDICFRQTIHQRLSEFRICDQIHQEARKPSEVLGSLKDVPAKKPNQQVV